MAVDFLCHVQITGSHKFPDEVLAEDLET